MYNNDRYYYITRAVKRLSSFDDSPKTIKREHSYEFVPYSWKAETGLSELLWLESKESIALVVGSNNYGEGYRNAPTVHEALESIITLGLIPETVDEVYFLASTDRSIDGAIPSSVIAKKINSGMTMLYNGSNENLGSTVMPRDALVRRTSAIVTDDIIKLTNMHSMNEGSVSPTWLHSNWSKNISCMYTSELSETQALVASQHVLACALSECVHEYLLTRTRWATWPKPGERYDNGTVKRAAKYLTLDNPSIVLGTAARSGQRIIMPFGMRDAEIPLFYRESINRYDEPRKNLALAETALKLANAYMMSTTDPEHKGRIIPRRKRESLRSYRSRIGYELCFEAIISGVPFDDLFST